jgi:anti-sigma-K factor RskA
MSNGEDSGRELSGDDALAAEYVLGVLAANDRRAAARRVETDPAFARLVDRWEADLSPIGADYAPVEPPAALKQAIDRRLYSSPAPTALRGSPEPVRAGLWASLAFWRGLTVAALAALALYVAVPLLVTPPSEAPQNRLVAALSAEGSEVRYVAMYDAATNEIGLSHLAGERGEGRDFELWVIEGGNAPQSLGVIPAGEAAKLTPKTPLKEKIAKGAVFAISLEPAGGSPTGAPTGPVVAAGDLRAI